MNTKPNDGGAAFPTAATATTHGFYAGDQPCMTHHGSQPGMTLRAWFAGQALMGWAAGRNRSMTESNPDKVAGECVAYADALIRSLEAKP